MSVSIQEVLTLLPELFPGVQSIPLDLIRFNPDNPGPPASDDEVAQLAANIAEVGLNNPVKMGPDKADPLAPGVTLHPDNPRLKGTGQPWKVKDFNYRLLSGETRCRAFQKLQRAAIPGTILNPTATEAAVILALDNKIRKRGWWWDYQSVEPLIKANPNLTQGQVAVNLELDRPLVNHAIQILPLLNPEARALISNNVTNSNKGNKGISESAVSQLAVLGPESPFKPGPKKKSLADGGAGSPTESAHPNHGPRLEASAQGEPQKLWPYPGIPPETQDLVRRTLSVAIDRKMTQAKAKALVQWVKEGNRPEDYSAEGALRSTAVHAKAAVAPQGSAQVAPVSQPNPEALKEPDLHSQVGTAIAGHELGKRLHLPTQLMNRLLPVLTRLFHRARGLFARLGIKNPTLATFLTLLLFLFAGSALINLTGRLMNGLWNGIFYIWSSQSATQPTLTDPGRMGKPVSNPAVVSQVVSDHLSSGPQAGGQGLVVPSRSADGNGGTQGGSAHLSPGIVGAPPLPPINSSGAPAKSASTTAKGGDVLTQIGAGVKNYQSAVNTADQAKSATDKVKSLLGF
jgi:hypothetical protein